MDYLYGYGLSTGYLNELMFYLPGVIIRHPTVDAGGQIPEFVDSPKLYKVFREAEKWSQIIKVENVAQLNKMIEQGRGGDLIRMNEAYLENQIADIASEIYENADRIKLILIAGPHHQARLLLLSV